MPRKRDGFVPLGDVAEAVELSGDLRPPPLDMSSIKKTIRDIPGYAGIHLTCDPSLGQQRGDDTNWPSLGTSPVNPLSIDIVLAAHSSCGPDTLPANKKKDPGYTGICRDIVGYSGI